MTKKELISEMVKVQTEIHNALEQLKLLDNEKAYLLEMARNYDVELPIELQTRMQKSLEHMKKWANKLKTLRIKSDQLKSKMDFEIANANGGNQ